jgi:hypothetical protein
MTFLTPCVLHRAPAESAAPGALLLAALLLG